MIVFHRLTQDLIKGIVELQLKQLEKILAQKELSLTVSPAAVEQIAREGYDPVYGARPLKRLIQKKIQDRLAMLLLNGDVQPRRCNSFGSRQANGELAFDTKKHAQ